MYVILIKDKHGTLQANSNTYETRKLAKAIAKRLQGARTDVDFVVQALPKSFAMTAMQLRCNDVDARAGHILARF